MGIPIETIKQLREATRVGVMDCRRALEQANGSYEQAMALLQEKAAEAAAKRAEREASQGIIELYSHARGRIGVMIEVNTETDFAARSEAFRTLAHELALHIAAASPRWVSEADIPPEEIESVAEEAAARASAEGKPEAIIERIVEGQVAKFKDETVLLRQPYIRDESMKVSQLLSRAAASTGENIVLRRFIRWELGETTAEA